MRPKHVFLVVPLMACLTYLTPALAVEAVTKKLGYGFGPGLVAGKDYVAGQLIVGVNGGMTTQTFHRTVTALGGNVSKEIHGTALLVQFPSETAVVSAASSLSARPEVRFVERNGFLRVPPPSTQSNPKGQRTDRATLSDLPPLLVSNDAGTGHQWHHTVIRKTASLPALSATPPTVAVIDTGVDYTHSDLSGKVLLGKNSVANNFDPFDDNGRGTHMAGLIAAKAANNIYGEGVCPNCKILAVKVLGANRSGTFFDVADGMHYAHSVVTTPVTRVLNLSVGGSNSALVALEVDHVKAAGKVLVVAAGDSNTTNPSGAFPGADPDSALRVTATEENDCRTTISNFSPAALPAQYNIAAPGFNIYSTTMNEGFAPDSGTAMASSIVAGAAAVVWGQFPAFTRDQLIARVVNTGKGIPCGFAAATRRLDVRRAILGTVETALIGRILDPFTGTSPNPNTTPTNARLFLGSTQLAIDGTNRGGSYEMTGLTPGARVLRGERAGYVNTALRLLTTASGLVVGPSTDALPKARPVGNATITLDWKTTQPADDTPGCVDACNGWDFDLTVKLPTGIYIDPFFNTGDLIAAPFVKNPRDSADDSEPVETVVIGATATDGVYRVVVDRPYDATATGLRFSPFWTGSQASVQLYNGATPFGAFYGAPPATCTTATKYWHVGNLTKTGTAYTWASVNACTNVKP